MNGHFDIKCCDQHCHFQRSHRRGCSRVIRLQDNVGHYVLKDASCNVNEIKLLFHTCRHTGGKARKLLADIFLKSGTSPPSQFLYLSVTVTRQRERICAATVQRVRINAIDGNPFMGWVIEQCSSDFNALANIGIGDVKALGCEKCR